jgi:hypothetical protein
MADDEPRVTPADAPLVAPERFLAVLRACVAAPCVFLCFVPPWLLSWAASLAWHGLRAGWRDGKRLTEGE